MQSCINWTIKKQIIFFKERLFFYFNTQFIWHTDHTFIPLIIKCVLAKD